MSPAQDGAAELADFGRTRFVLQIGTEPSDELEREVRVVVVIDRADHLLRVPRGAHLVAGITGAARSGKSTGRGIGSRSGWCLNGIGMLAKSRKCPPAPTSQRCAWWRSGTNGPPRDRSAPLRRPYSARSDPLRWRPRRGSAARPRWSEDDGGAGQAGNQPVAASRSVLGHHRVRHSAVCSRRPSLSCRLVMHRRHRPRTFSCAVRE
jgi:hypothetical protein